MKKIKVNNKLGFTLIEILLVFAIAMLIIVSAFFIYKKVQSQNEANETVSVMQNIAINMKTLYGNSQREAQDQRSMSQSELDFIFKQEFPRGLETTQFGAVYKKKNFFILPDGQIALKNYTVAGFSLILPTSECAGVISQLIRQGNFIFSAKNVYAQENSMAASYAKQIGQSPITKLSPTVYNTICSENDISSELNNFSYVTLLIVE